MLKMLDGGIGPRDKYRFVATVTPSHEVRRETVQPVYCEHFAVAVGLTEMVALDHDAITDADAHIDAPSLVPSGCEPMVGRLRRIR
jgi:hypothetical protein